MKNFKLLSKIAVSFQNLDNFDRDMKEILEDIGNVIDVSRIYIFFNETNEIVNNTFEWCKKGVNTGIRKLQNMKYEDRLYLEKILKENGYICQNDIMNLSKDIINEVERQEIKSLIIYPLIIQKEIRGVIGFDECRYKRKWKEEEIEILSTVSVLISSAYERKSFHQDTIASETNFHNFFETIDDMFIVSDLQGRIIHFNNSLIDKLGYSFLELKDMNISELHPINKKEEASSILKEMLIGGKNYCQLEIEGKLGEIYSVETRIWHGKWDKEDCIYSISKDTTKENENLILFSKIFENNPLSMAITSMDERRFVKINPVFSKKTGYSEEDIIGKTIEELNIFLDFEKLREIEKRRMKYGQVKDEELVIRCKDGSLIIGVFSIEEISNEGKKSLLTVMVDVTERVELTKNVEYKLQQLTNIIEGANLGTWEWDIKTGKIEINEQWARMIGYSLEELQPTNFEMWTKFAHNEDLKATNKILKKHLNSEIEYYDREVRMKHKDKRWIWIQDRGKVIERDKSGSPVKMFGIHSDITGRKQAEEALKESEKRFLLAFDETKAGLWDIDMISGNMFLSPMWKSMLGYSEDEIENSLDGWKKLWHPDDKDYIQKSMDDYLEGRSKSYKVIHRLKHKDGYWRWILNRGGILKDCSGKPYRWIGTNIDITKEQEQSLELERFFSVNLDLLCIIDMKGKFIKVNKAWEDILGYPSYELTGRKFLDFVYQDDMDSTLEAMERLRKCEKVTQFINRYISVDGDYRYIEWRLNPYEGVIYGAARDITDRIKYEKRILELSNRDTLTNIYNRRYVFDRAEEIIEEYKRIGKIFSVCILDIDNFKNINDNYGHQIGDCVLKQFTEIIDGNLRPYDILGRYGGEEFIVILNDTSEKESNLIIERILNITRNKSFACDGKDINITFSAGISNCREIAKDEMIIDNLVKIADERMYKAKNAGRNRIVSNL